MILDKICERMKDYDWMKTCCRTSVQTVKLARILVNGWSSGLEGLSCWQWLLNCKWPCWRRSPSQPTPFAKRDTYADADCDGFIDVVAHSPELWGNLGEEGREESVSSSMSECEEGGLVDFFFPKACLKELLSWKTNTDQDYFPHHSTLCAAHVLKS